MYAKSTGVDSFGSEIGSPFGVKTTISSSNKSIFNVSMNSDEVLARFLHSNSCFNQEIFLSNILSLSVPL